MLVLVEGPEKVGKTTLIEALVPVLEKTFAKVEVTHHGPWDPDDSIIAPMVKEHANDDILHIWDRGWGSEFVYATGLGRKRRANNNALLMEWLHGRAAIAKFSITGPAEELAARRDGTDLPIDVWREKVLFSELDWALGYTGFYNMYTPEGLQEIVLGMSAMIRYAADQHMPYVYGTPTSPVCFVASQTTGSKGDRWMPLSDNASFMAITTALGNSALNCAYTFSHKGSPALLSKFKHIVTFGKEAADWVKYYVPTDEYPKLHRLHKTGTQSIINQLTQLKELM
jgi:hypothetical protein